MTRIRFIRGEDMERDDWQLSRRGSAVAELLGIHAASLAFILFKLTAGSLSLSLPRNLNDSGPKCLRVGPRPQLSCSGASMRLSLVR